MIFIFIDLKFHSGYTSLYFVGGMDDEFRKNCFSQIMDYLPMYEFRKCVNRYNGNYHTSSFMCMDQFLGMAFAQLTYRESLRDIEVSSFTSRKALSSRHSGSYLSQHAGRRK